MRITTNNIQDVFKSKPASTEIMQMKGYTLLEDLLCDNSGLGSENEPAYTQSQLEKRIKELLKNYPTLYTTITGAGQFQVYIGIFIKTGKSTIEQIAGHTYSFYKDGVYTIKYHDTDIVKMLDNKITLNNGGYYTRTTKDRINTFVYQYGYNVFQKDYNWYIKNTSTGAVTEYTHGITLPTN